MSQEAVSRRTAAVASPSEEASVRVLAVDDQPLVGEAVRRALARQPNILFRYCGSLAGAIPQAESFKPTVILQDLVMPGVGGLSAIQHYRSHPATHDIPIIVLSSRDEPALKSLAFTAGADDYLVKLPDEIELVARVRHHSKAYQTRLQRDEAHRALGEARQRLEHLEPELLAVQHQLETAVCDTSRLLAELDQEIARPLAGVVGLVRQLLAPQPGGERQEGIAALYQGTSELHHALIEILELEQINAGTLQLEHAPFSLEACLDEALSVVAPQAAEQGAALVAAVTPEVPDGLVGDAARLRHILVSLLLQALGEATGGEVTVTVRASEGVGAGEAGLHFAVAGPGLLAGVVPLLPSPLRQAGQLSRSADPRPGLAISQRLAELMGGSLRARTEDGRWTTFCLNVALRTCDGPRRVVPAPGRGLIPGYIHPLEAHLVPEDDVPQEVFAGRGFDSSQTDTDITLCLFPPSAGGIA